MSTIHLQDPPPHPQFSISLEREETGGERQVLLFKDVVLFLVAIAFVLLIAWLCYSTLSTPSSTPEEKKWPCRSFPPPLAALSVI